MQDLNTDIQKIQTPLQKYISKMVRDKMLAEDILQETMIIALRKQEALNDNAKLLPWCKTIARNLYFRQLQKMHNEDMFDEATHIITKEMGQVEKSYQNQKTAALLQLLTQLPEGQRALAREYYLLGTPRKDICRKYHITTQAFDSRLLRARKKLQSYLKRRHKQKADIEFINRFTDLVRGDYTMDDFRIEISPQLIPDLIEVDENIITFIRSHRKRCMEDFNIQLPMVHIIDSQHLKGDEYIILLEEKRIQEGELESNDKLSEINQLLSDIMSNHFQ